MNELKNKRILFFCPKFFNYSQLITQAFESLGAIVDSFDERPSNSFLAKALIRLKPDLIKAYTDNYYDNIFQNTAKHKYDYILFVKAEAISADRLEKLKELHPEAKMILYLWDSLKNFASKNNKIELFDRCLSFDKDDSAKYNMQFRPLFYSHEYAAIASNKTNIKYDIFFVGTMHSDRYRFLQKIKSQAQLDGKNIMYYLFFMSKILYYKMKLQDKIVRKTSISDFKFVPLRNTEILKYVELTKVIIDIQHPGQTGLTMRSVETLGAKRKLITTNKQIVDYDFYNSNNILVVDRDNPVIHHEFLDSDFVDIPDSIYEKYSLDNWIKDVIAIETV